eukprot:2415505-Pyramimonas_sp.AAC.2
MAVSPAGPDTSMPALSISSGSGRTCHTRKHRPITVPQKEYTCISPTDQSQSLNRNVWTQRAS